MHNRRIEELLDAFYAGQSTREEEAELKAFFEQESVPAEWEADQRLFRLMQTEKQAVDLPEGLAERLESQIDNWADSEKKQPARRVALWKYVASAAAIALLCVSIAISVRPAGNQMADTFDDPREAAMVAQEALTLVSANLNKGLDQISRAQEINKQVEQTLNKISKNEK